MIDKHRIDELTKELADAAGLTIDEASRVLSVFKVEKLARNANSMKKGLTELSSANIPNLGLSAPELKERIDASDSMAFTVSNLRLSLKPSGINMSSIAV